LPAGNRSF